jgi:hypothetical protein
VREVASNLNFPERSPFHDGSFSPILGWVKAEQDLLKRVEKGDLDAEDRERIWEMLTHDFVGYRKGLRAAYIKSLEQTYQYAQISLPSTS